MTGGIFTPGSIGLDISICLEWSHPRKSRRLYSNDEVTETLRSSKEIWTGERDREDVQELMKTLWKWLKLNMLKWDVDHAPQFSRLCRAGRIRSHASPLWHEPPIIAFQKIRATNRNHGKNRLGL
jgi:hypothetical protein